MADVEVDLLVDLEEARRRLGEFRRELDGVERQAEEIQDRPGGPRPGGAPADETGRKKASATGKKIKALEKKLNKLKFMAMGKIEAVEAGLNISANLMFQFGKRLEKIPGMGELGNLLTGQATAISGYAAMRERAAAAAATTGKITDLVQGGVAVDAKMVKEIMDRAQDQAKRDRQAERILDRERAARGGDAVAKLVAEALGGG